MGVLEGTDKGTGEGTVPGKCEGNGHEVKQTKQTNQ